MNTEETKAPETEAAPAAAPQGRAPRAPRRDAGRNGRGPRREGGRRGETPVEEGPQLMEKVVYVNRCAKVVKGGRRFSFSALIVVGDQKGKVGYGFGKANEVSDAIRKGTDAAKRAMKKVVVVNETIPHEVYSEFGGAKIVLKPAASGTGLVASAKVRAVLEAAGVNNVIAKSLGSSNAANVVKAVMQAMLGMRTADQILAARGKKKKEAAQL
ncbi:MAG: 30S ribosomal protein S5 [Akkermansia sp.]